MPPYPRRDPRWTPGALGYALGDEPDLSNLTCSTTLLNEGDAVFLASDGVSDNFDPLVLKIAKQAVPRFSEECRESQVTGGKGGGGEGYRGCFFYQILNRRLG